MCSNASITEILGINDNNLVILGNKKENIKGIEYTVLRGKLSYRPDSCPKCGMYRPPKVRPKNLTIGRSVFSWQNILLKLRKK